MPAPAVHSLADYVGLLQRLLPRGRVWPRDADAVQTAMLNGLAPTPQRIDQAASDLITAAFPSTTTYLMGEWEATLGLPARFGGSVGTLAQRRLDIVAALAQKGGQSIDYFITYAAQLGYTINSITQFTAWTVDTPIDQPISGLDFVFAFRVEVPTGFDYTRLRNMLDLYKPAHTTYYFVFV